jgi:hypothetical protein
MSQKEKNLQESSALTENVLTTSVTVSTFETVQTFEDNTNTEVAVNLVPKLGWLFFYAFSVGIG